MSAGLDETRNCTLEAYARAKALPAEFLQSHGLETIANPYVLGQQAIKVPYLTTEGTLHRHRIRAALKPSTDGDNRMLWDKQPEGLGTILYGLHRLNGAGSCWSRGRATRRRYGSTVLMRSDCRAPATPNRSAMTAISRAVKSLPSWRVMRAA
jgi:hypothetical protein